MTPDHLPDKARPADLVAKPGPCWEAVTNRRASRPPCWPFAFSSGVSDGAGFGPAPSWWRRPARYNRAQVWT